MEDKYITLAHGNGGRFMRELIDSVFVRHLANPGLDVHADAVTLPLLGKELMFTTDGFSVQPLEFPGGDIGSLAVHGTTNDLAVAGAIPRYLSLNAFIEEGLEVAQLERIVISLAQAAQEIDVQVVAGDTKVVPRGNGGGLYLATTGIGVREKQLSLALNRIMPGDAILVSGSVGDHGTAVMLAREQFGLKGSLKSDAATVLPLTKMLMDYSGLRFMRDPTRGGLATVVHEISQFTGHTVRLHQQQIPVRPQVQSVCEMLGFDPHYLACEGRVIAVIDNAQADDALEAMRQHPTALEAALIGYVEEGGGHVVLETELGGERILEELEDDPLPRIC
ncbi:MAG: hydrogenase expression/formation protein HypE [Gammaproteobacteria bacterium]|nr:hydrogenase expression/formation protein HypE [Gammaproteobacteria bacterium]